MDPFIGEIRAFGFGNIPRGWALCDGSLLSIQQNAALFSLLGTVYGGNGTSTFALPDLRGRVPLGMGVGPDGQPHNVGQAGGKEGEMLTQAQMPPHNHVLTCNSGDEASNAPAGSIPAFASSSSYTPLPGGATLAAGALAASGGSSPHNNMQPSLTVNLCIAVQGLYPSRP
ncbi:MAG TPA: tail fiber protein [Azospira sp.]|nr:tail fiber protein [Azospira sp.]